MFIPNSTCSRSDNTTYISKNFYKVPISRFRPRLTTSITLRKRSTTHVKVEVGCIRERSTYVKVGVGCIDWAAPQVGERSTHVKVEVGCIRERPTHVKVGVGCIGFGERSTHVKPVLVLVAVCVWLMTIPTSASRIDTSKSAINYTCSFHNTSCGFLNTSSHIGQIINNTIPDLLHFFISQRFHIFQVGDHLYNLFENLFPTKSSIQSPLFPLKFTLPRFINLCKHILHHGIRICSKRPHSRSPSFSFSCYNRTNISYLLINNTRIIKHIPKLATQLVINNLSKLFNTLSSSSIFAKRSLHAVGHKAINICNIISPSLFALYNMLLLGSQFLSQSIPSNLNPLRSGCLLCLNLIQQSLTLLS